MATKYPKRKDENIIWKVTLVIMMKLVLVDNIFDLLLEKYRRYIYEAKKDFEFENNHFGYLQPFFRKLWGKIAIRISDECTFSSHIDQAQIIILGHQE